MLTRVFDNKFFDLIKSQLQMKQIWKLFHL